MEKITWDVGEPGGGTANKMEYVALRKITKEMNPAEKKGTELWNQMVEIVRAVGRMEDKK